MLEATQSITTPPLLQNVDNHMKLDIIDPRRISKKLNSEQRQQIARETWEARTAKRAVANEERAIETEAVQVETNLHADRAELLDKQAQLETDLEAKMAKFAGIFGVEPATVRNLRAEIAALTESTDADTERKKQLEQRIAELQSNLNTLPDPKRIIEGYYESVANTPLMNAEKREVLKPEFLASLSMGEYIALWKRLNPFFLAHATRQGFRDHNAMEYHSGGLDQLARGLEGILSDSHMLRPPFSLKGLTDRQPETIRSLLNARVLKADTEDEALKRLDDEINFTRSGAPKYPDKTAVHLTAEVVADDYYGGEVGNEIFFVFPTDSLASQNLFALNGPDKDLTKYQRELRWNDVFVWPRDLNNPGFSIDSGITFLPKSIRVDKETGSRYATQKTADGGLTLVENTELKDRLLTWGKTFTGSPTHELFVTYESEGHYVRREDLKWAFIHSLANEMKQLGLEEMGAYKLAWKIHEFIFTLYLGPEILEDCLQQSRTIWKPAEDTVRAEDYWEGYFSQHPERKPKHIVYYDGDPTDAVRCFIRDNGIGQANTSTTEGHLLGFDDHHVVLKESGGGLKEGDGQDPRAFVGYNELMTTAKQIIHEHYALAGVQQRISSLTQAE